MPTCMSFPLEMNVFIKERNNGWYDVPAYYYGKVIDLISRVVETNE